MEAKKSFNDRAYEAVKRVPYGKVATYEQIAVIMGNLGLARAVGNVLHKNPQEFPMCEGVKVQNGRVDLSRYQWL